MDGFYPQKWVEMVQRKHFSFQHLFSKGSLFNFSFSSFYEPDKCAVEHIRALQNANANANIYDKCSLYNLLILRGNRAVVA